MGYGGNNFWGSLVMSLRTEQNISQRQLASGAKVNRSTLRRIEEGSARGDIDTMERLLMYLGYELEAMTSASVEERAKMRAAQEHDPTAKSRLFASHLLNMSPDSLLK